MDNSSSNATQPMSHGGLFKPAYDSSLIVLAFLIILVNLLVVYLFVTKDYLRTKTNSFLVSLALSDFMTGLLSIPLFVICAVNNGPQVCLASSVLYRCSAVSTMAHIMVVTSERYVAVMFPMRYYRMVTKARVCILIALVWLFSITYATIELSWLDVNNHNITTNVGEFAKYDKPYKITGLILCFTIPLCVMLFCFGRMFIVIRRQVKNIRRQAELAADPRSRSIASDKRAILIFATMLGIFMVCWLTWYLTLFQVALGKGAIIPETFLDALDFFRFSTSLINPMLYTFLKIDFRRAVCSLLARCCKCDLMVKPKPDASRMTFTTDGNGNKNLVRSNGVSPVPNRAKQLVYRDSQDLPTTDGSENQQLITHV